MNIVAHITKLHQIEAELRGIKPKKRLKTNVSFKGLLGRGSGEEFQMMFQGEGWVLIQPYEEVYFQQK